MQQPRLADIYAAALHSGIKPGTLRQRLKRGTLTHHGYDHRGRVRVDLNELPARADNVPAATAA
ncbi:hypothetical protein OG530_19235 [Streptomyces decoyicus]|uniref:hypothetical protein n=1 Tax=Streptomyces decoyicus TaxID=249567 RepID=UPI002E19E892